VTATGRPPDHSDAAVEREFARIHTAQEFHGHGDLGNARHGKAPLAVQGHPGARFDVDRRDADLAADPTGDRLEGRPDRVGHEAGERVVEAGGLGDGSARRAGESEQNRDERPPHGEALSASPC
jgi:hypothetical protein